MKVNKYYIPLISQNGKNVTMIRADKIGDINELIPSNKEILEHIFSQKILKDEDKKHEFHSIKIEVNKEKYNNFISQIMKKAGTIFRIPNCIDLCFDSSTLPIIQIIPK